jgi:hypothetical protein
MTTLRWVSMSVLLGALLAAGNVRAADRRDPAPDAEMLLDLELLKDPEFAKQRDLLRKMPLIERIRVLENLPLLERDAEAVPAGKGERK